MNIEVVRVEIAKLEPKPGDTLLVRANAPITREQGLALQECFRKVAPDGVLVVVMTTEIEVTLIKDDKTQWIPSEQSSAGCTSATSSLASSAVPSMTAPTAEL